MYLGRIFEAAPREAIFRGPYHPYTRLRGLRSPRCPRSSRPRHSQHRARLGVSQSAEAPPGCAYHPPCPEAGPRCRMAAPRPVQDGETMVACHLHDGGTSGTTNHGTDMNDLSNNTMSRAGAIARTPRSRATTCQTAWCSALVSRQETSSRSRSSASTDPFQWHRQIRFGPPSKDGVLQVKRHRGLRPSAGLRAPPAGAPAGDEAMAAAGTAATYRRAGAAGLGGGRRSCHRTAIGRYSWHESNARCCREVTCQR
jgi:oligopeptide/dipeptide ABC transporter ATP-binding protein